MDTIEPLIEATPAEQLALATLDLGPDGRRIVAEKFAIETHGPAGPLSTLNLALRALVLSPDTEAVRLAEDAQERADVLAVASPGTALALAGAYRRMFLTVMRSDLGEEHDRAAMWLRAVRRTITRNEPGETP